MRAANRMLSYRVVAGMPCRARVAWSRPSGIEGSRVDPNRGFTSATGKSRALSLAAVYGMSPMSRV